MTRYKCFKRKICSSKFNCSKFKITIIIIAGQPIVWSAEPPIGQGQAGDLAHDNSFIRAVNEIGRASCRERV